VHSHPLLVKRVLNQILPCTQECRECNGKQTTITCTRLIEHLHGTWWNKVLKLHYYSHLCCETGCIARWHTTIYVEGIGGTVNSWCTNPVHAWFPCMCRIWVKSSMNIHSSLFSSSTVDWRPFGWGCHRKLCPPTKVSPRQFLLEKVFLWHFFLRSNAPPEKHFPPGTFSCPY